MVLAPLWLQAVIVTFVIGFAILGYLTIRVYQDHPPVPGVIVSQSGRTIFTADDIRGGQELFLTYGLMQYGSVYGHGAYLGPDFTADYLHRQAVELQRIYGGDASAEERTRRELQANRYDPATDTRRWSEGQAAAFAAWHLQLALFFVVGAYLAAGLFLAPIITGTEPRGQRALAFILLAAVVVVVVSRARPPPGPRPTSAVSTSGCRS
jgi:nitric oxide reductase large subunit